MEHHVLNYALLNQTPCDLQLWCHYISRHTHDKVQVGLSNDSLKISLRTCRPINTCTCAQAISGSKISVTFYLFISNFWRITGLYLHEGLIWCCVYAHHIADDNRQLSKDLIVALAACRSRFGGAGNCVLPLMQ